MKLNQIISHKPHNGINLSKLNSNGAFDVNTAHRISIHYFSDTTPLECFDIDPNPLLARGVIDPETGEMIVWDRDVLHNSMSATDLFKGRNPYFHFEDYFPIEIDKHYNIQCAYLRQMIDDIRSPRYEETKRMLVYYNKSIKSAKKKHTWIKSSDTYKV